MKTAEDDRTDERTGEHSDNRALLSTVGRAGRVTWSVLLVLALVAAAHVLSQDLGAFATADDTAADPPSAPAAAPTTRLAIHAESDLETVDDPIALYAAGEHWLGEGNPELARKCFEKAVSSEEINLYKDFAGTPWGEAAILERMGKLDDARARWRATFHDDVLTAYLMLTHFSIDPEKQALLDAARAHVESLVAQAKGGASPHWYTTRKGASRTLTAMSGEEALAKLQAGERLKYVYIDTLDVTGQRFPDRVGCQRCVVGELRAWGATFDEQLDFQGFVLGDAHLGRHWHGEVNRSGFDDAAVVDRLYLGSTVVLGNLNLDSVKVLGRVANMPMVVVEGEADARNIAIAGTTEFRYSAVRGELDLRGAKLSGVGYFGHAKLGGLTFSRVVASEPVFFDATHFAGPATFERCELTRGLTLESATMRRDLLLRQCRLGDRLNLSRAVVHGDLLLSQVEGTSVDALGVQVHGATRVNDSVLTGNVRFALDGLTRRLHIDDPRPLHKLYKAYQGDVDAEDELTRGNQYGVVHVDDLTASLMGDVSFANTIFQKFVSFEGVRFGSNEGQEASFYNAQFYGEAHFERTEFVSAADFRTISGSELAFNDAVFRSTWMLDDANIPGRLTMSGAKLERDATLSFYGAQIAAFNVTFQQLLNAEGEHRLYYEQCVDARADDARFLDDVRLADAHWDSEREEAIEDRAIVLARAARMCMDRTTSEFVGLKDSFNKRSMTQESDWAYWHLRHYKNKRDTVYAEGFFGRLGGWLGWLLFEKGFGWGVHLSNLLWTGLVVILFFMGLQRIFCAKMLVEWDNEVRLLSELPVQGQFLLSLHAFLGRARDWRAKASNPVWKIFYTSEMVIGIILITFFIGAYTRMVLR